MLLRLFLLVVASLSISAPVARAEPEAVQITIVPRDGSKSTVIGLKAITEAFADKFKEMCFDNRGSLAVLRTLSGERGWEKVTDNFPRRDSMGSTEIAWNGGHGGAPFLLSLEVHDTTTPSLTCSNSSAFLQKTNVPNLIHRATGLVNFRNYEENGLKYNLFSLSDDPYLRVLCITPLSEQDLDGQCSLVRVLPSQSLLDGRDASCTQGTILNGRRALGADKCLS